MEGARQSVHVQCLSGFIQVGGAVAHTPAHVVETRGGRVAPERDEGTDMPTGKGIYDDHDADERDERKAQRTGPKDEGGEGGMATRESAPDVAESGGEPTA